MGGTAGKGSVLKFVGFPPPARDKWRSRLILLLALLNGLLYLFFVPPWQHYDEPGHFDYAWLIASRGVLPQAGDYDPTMRREVAASMIEHGFFHGMDFMPNLLAQAEPVWIGPTQVGNDPPFYYLMVALPLRLIRFADVTFQLYVARTVSLLLYVLSVWLAGRSMAELVGESHVLRWAVPGMMALLPAYTDLMTAVNNDVGAVGTFSLFLWGAVRMVARGFSWPRLVWVAAAAALCVWTKNTVAVAVLLAPLAVALSVFRGPRQWLAWLAFAAVGVALLMAAFGWGDAAMWYRRSDQEIPTRQKRAESPLGEAALAVEMAPQEPGRSLMQPLLQADVEALRGQAVTLGAWIWASGPVRVRSPILDDGHQAIWEPIEVGPTPTFYALRATIAAEAKEVRIILSPQVDRTVAQTVTVWYDGLVLAEGARPLDQVPLFDDPAGREGVWGGELFVNHIRNGSAEVAWPRVRGWVEKGSRDLPLHLPVSLPYLVGLWDWAYTGRAYKAALVNMFRSFWARFGWNHVGLASEWYTFLAGWTAIGIASAGVSMARARRAYPSPTQRALPFLGLAGAMVWGICLLRTDYFQPFIPGARYAYPAIVPTALALMGGWLAWAPRRARRWTAVGLLCGMALLDGVSLVTIWTFYGR